MKEIKGNIWTFHEPNSNDYIVIPTNGVIKENGDAVMGKGLARDCKMKYPNFPKMLGNELKTKGNVVTLFKKHGIITFPVKPSGLLINTPSDRDKILPVYREKFHVGMFVTGWMCIADIDLITRSTERLYHVSKDINKVYLPRVGCGNGGLQWEDIKPVLAEKFKDEPKIIIVRL